MDYSRGIHTHRMSKRNLETMQGKCYFIFGVDIRHHARYHLIIKLRRGKSLEEKTDRMKSFFWNVCVSLMMMMTKPTDAWYVQKGQIYHDRGDLYSIRGLSWFGFETQDFVINGLWVHSMTEYLDKIQEVNVTTLRVPFSAEWIFYNFNLYPYDGLVSADPVNQHKPSIDILDTLFQECEKRNITIVLDLHR